MARPISYRWTGRGDRVLQRPILIASLLILGGVVALAQPLQIRVSQSNQPVEFSAGETDLIAGAGSDIVDWFYSAVNEKTLDIRNPDNNWRVDISRSDTTWHTGLRIEVLRTGDGTGSGTLTGGDDDYTEITTSATPLFYGTNGDARTVPLQFRLRGQFGYYVVPAGTYPTTIIYTVYDDI